MTVEEIRSVVEKVQPSARIPSAIGQVCGIGSRSYLPMIELAGALRLDGSPAAVQELAEWVASEYSRKACTAQHDQLSRILEVLHGLDLGGPGREAQRKALHAYRDAMAALLTGDGDR